MSLLKNMLNGSINRSPAGEDVTKDIDGDTGETTDIFESGHRLTALENIGSSLTTLWSNCALNVISSKDNIEKQGNQKNKPSTANDISGTAHVDSTQSVLAIEFKMESSESS